MSSSAVPDILWLIMNSPNCSIALRNLCFSFPSDSLVTGSTHNASDIILIPSSKIIICSSKEEESNDIFNSPISASSNAILSSSIAVCSSNPSWTFSGMFGPSVISSSQSFAEMGMRKFLVKVIHCPQSDSSEEFFLLSEEVDLSRLIPLKVSKERHNFPLNFLFIVIEDTLYTTESMYRRIQSLSPQQFPPLTDTAGITFFCIAGDDEEHVDESKTGDLSLSALCCRRIAESELRLETLRNQILHDDGASSIKATIEREKKLATLKALRETVFKAEAMQMQEEREILCNKKELSRLRGEEMKQSLDRLSSLSDQLRESAATLQQRKSKLSKVRFLFEARQVKLLSDLQSIYPIDPGSSFSTPLGTSGDGDGQYGGVSSIRGIELVNDNPMCFILTCMYVFIQINVRIHTIFVHHLCINRSGAARSCLAADRETPRCCDFARRTSWSPRLSPTWPICSCLPASTSGSPSATRLYFWAPSHLFGTQVPLNTYYANIPCPLYAKIWFLGLFRV